MYNGRGEGDLVVAFIALCKALGVEARYVTLWSEPNVHTVAEVALGDAWFVYDIAAVNAEPVEGVVTKKNGFEGWKLWRKGRDAWDIGLRSFKDGNKLCEEFDCGKISKR